MYKILAKHGSKKDSKDEVEKDYGLMSNILNLAQDFISVIGSVRLHLMFLSLFIDCESDVLRNSNIKL